VAELPTEQQLFSKVWDHFIAQRKPAGADFATSPIKCRFSMGCAVGILVTPEDAKEMDRIGSFNCVSMLFELLEQEETLKKETLAMLVAHENFIWGLEDAHDMAVMSINFDDPADPAIPERFTQKMKYFLTELANKYSLQVPT
jgi:hypothetical protein